MTVLSPHRDDAAFSIGLAIGYWLDQGHQVDVVNCFTRSAYGPFVEREFVHGKDRQSYISDLRHREDRKWILGYRQSVGLIDLDLRDAPQRLCCNVDEVCNLAVNPQDEAITEIRRALKTRVKDALVLPLGIGDHVDHLTARIAADANWPACLPIAFYEDLPYAARSGKAEEIDARVESLACGLVSCFVCTEVDLAQAVATKRAYALCYDSQINTEVADQIACFCERYHGRERLWVNRAWRDAIMGTAS